MKKIASGFAIFAFILASGCSNSRTTGSANTAPTPRPSPTPKNISDLKKISFLLTNDIHGHLEPATFKNGNVVGGMAYLGTVADSIRNQPEYKKNEAAFFVLDSGDQFQGTLLSNFNEGRAVFQAMNEVGYDAVVPGNHDYDFGPIGWLYDKVTPGKTGENPREVIEGLANLARFPLLSANTYFKSSIRYAGSTSPLALDSSCKLANASSKEILDFSYGTRPAFLKPWVIIEKAGVRVALIGTDNRATATTTTVENVNDLCFRDEVETYLEVRKELEGKADIFVLMMHNGNSDNSSDATRITTEINARYEDGIHLVAAGHTHFIHNANVNGVRVMQDGAENRYFGRVDLFFDPKTKKVVPENTLSKAGAPIDHDACSDADNFICQQYPLPLKAKPSIQLIINDAEKDVAPMAKQLLADAKEPIGRDRILESAMANILTDALRATTKTDISFMNTGGIRSELSAGPVYYESLFEVLPFSNMAVVMNSVPWSVIKKVLARSVQTCGQYGALMQSGLKIQFTRTCAASSDMDYSAKLVRVEMKSGKVLLDVPSGKEIADSQTFSVATLDFLAAGGSGYSEFKEASVDATLGIARELIVSSMLREIPVLTNKLDGRFKNIANASQ